MEQLLVGGLGNGLHHRVGKLGLEKSRARFKSFGHCGLDSWSGGQNGKLKMKDLGSNLAREHVADLFLVGMISKAAVNKPLWAFKC